MVRSFFAATTFAALFGATAIGPSQADAQDKYPSRPVKIVVSLPAGSSPDIRARIIAEQLTKMWGQQVVVENRPGGGGLIAVQALLSTAADGHTLLVATGSTFTILPAQKENLPIDVNRDLIPIGLVANEPMVVAASPKLGVNTLADLIALAKREPHKIVIGTNPAGSLPHLAGRLLGRTLESADDRASLRDRRHQRGDQGHHGRTGSRRHRRPGRASRGPSMRATSRPWPSCPANASPSCRTCRLRQKPFQVSRPWAFWRSLPPRERLRLSFSSWAMISAGHSRAESARGSNTSERPSDRSSRRNLFASSRASRSCGGRS